MTEELEKLLDDAVQHLVVFGPNTPYSANGLTAYRELLLLLRNNYVPENKRFQKEQWTLTTNDPSSRTALTNKLGTALSEHLDQGNLQTAAIEIYGGNVDGIKIDDILWKLIDLAIVHGTQKAAQIFVEAIDSPECPYYQYVLLGGITLDSDVQLYDGIKLVVLPDEMTNVPIPLPQSGIMQDLTRRFKRATVLEEQWQASPRFMTVQQYSQKQPQDDFAFSLSLASDSAPEFNRREFCRALSLVSKSQVYQSVYWPYLPEDEIANCHRAYGGMMFGHSGTFEPRTKMTYSQIEEARALYELLVKLDENTYSQLFVPIERLIASWGHKHPMDQIIDLAISLECLYLSDLKDELSYRLSIRTARFLETNPSERLVIKRLIKSLYDARSSAVHTGKIKDQHKTQGGKISTTDLIDATQELCLRSILQVVESGLPDWEQLELG